MIQSKPEPMVLENVELNITNFVRILCFIQQLKYNMLYCYLFLDEMYIFVILNPYLFNTSKFYDILQNVKNYIKIIKFLCYICTIHLCNLFVTKLAHICAALLSMAKSIDVANTRRVVTLLACIFC